MVNAEKPTMLQSDQQILEVKACQTEDEKIVWNVWKSFLQCAVCMAGGHWLFRWSAKFKVAFSSLLAPCNALEYLILHDGCNRLMALNGRTPLDLSFWSFLTFLRHGTEEVERHLLWKFHEKNSKEKLVKWATEVAHLRRVSIQSCTQKRPSPKVQWRSRYLIQLCYRLDYLYHTCHTCSSCNHGYKSLTQGF